MTKPIDIVGAFEGMKDSSMDCAKCKGIKWKLVNRYSELENGFRIRSITKWRCVSCGEIETVVFPVKGDDKSE